jgi:hypothetical protein
MSTGEHRLADLNGDGKVSKLEVAGIAALAALVFVLANALVGCG